MKGSTSSEGCCDSDRMMTVRTPKRSSCCGRLFVVMLLPLLLLLCLTVRSSVGGKTTTIVRHTDTTDPQLDGFWANKTSWNARWVKYWRAKRIYEPVWKKVWTPSIHTEWIPLPNAPEPDAWKKPNHPQHNDDEEVD
ncbi:hypothetical protein KR215_003274 [Drosophila sulfurigaster]|nr:hypothetical protein KR215_003274 [Drosophila sulfurigaster]